jgi:cytochrome c-type biogenesis protein CcmH/NrfG
MVGALIAVLAVGMFIALALVLRRSRCVPSSRFAHDFELLKAEEMALESQITAGEVTPEDASALRNELRRRVLSLRRLADAAPDLKDGPVPMAYGAVGVVLVLCAGFYIWTTQNTVIEKTPKLPATKMQRGKLERGADFEALMQEGQKRFVNGNHAGAFDAYEAASALDPSRVEAWLAQGEALVAAEKGQISPAAMLAFAQAEQASPGNPVTQYYSGLERLQQGDAGAAQAIWRALKARSRPSAPWMPQLNRGLEAAARALGEEGEAEQGPEIGIEQIEGMVAGLAARLEAEPDDPQGWLMLARSYMVLGREDDARSALSRLEQVPEVPSDVADTAAQMRDALTQK